MQKQNSVKRTVEKGMLPALAGALATTLLATILLIILEVLLVKTIAPSDRTINLLSYAVRVLSLGAGAFAFARKGTGKAWQRGLLLGCIYWGLFFLIHSVTVKMVSFSLPLTLDALFCIAVSFFFSVLFAKH